MKKLLSVGAMAGFSILLPEVALAQYNMFEYWITPPNRYGTLQTILWTNPANPNLETCRAAPGPTEHSFWRGTFMGRSVALQAGVFPQPAPDNEAYDVFETTPSAILYWGTFRGNRPDSDTSHPLDASVLWMNASMPALPDPGATISGTMHQRELTNGLRRETNVGGADCGYTVTVRQHYQAWSSTIDPAGTAWPDVLYVTYDTSCPGQTPFTEEYWLAKGAGTIAFRTSNRAEPSCVEKQYAIKPSGSDALGLRPFSNGLPLVPWFDPFKWPTHVKNGFFQSTLQDVGGSDRAPLSAYAYAWKGWSGTMGSGTPDTQDVLLAPNGRTGSGDLYAALRVQPSAGWDAAVSDPIDVIPNTVYRLSGWLYRDAGGTNDVYLDMHDIAGDTNIMMTGVGWQWVSGDICVGSLSSIKVRCVRDNLNTANAGCDGVTLQRVDGVTLTTSVTCNGQPGGSGGGTGGSGSAPGCYLGVADGICQHSEKYVVLNPDGTYTRKTTCPQDCPSCGSVGGDYCAQAQSCPTGYTFLQATFDCPSCCHTCASTGCPSGTCGWQTDNCGTAIYCGSCLPSCGTLGGNYCSQTTACPSGYSSLGQSSDCTRCCKSLPTCGSLGGNYCSQSASCPAYYSSLGPSYDCVRCCSCHPRSCPSGSCGWQSDNCGGSIWCGSCLQSCGQMGGSYCSQSGSCPAGYDSLGRSTDCQSCCRPGPSCGSIGGNYCSQNGSCPAGYGDLGRTYDCNHCCQS